MTDYPSTKSERIVVPTGPRGPNVDPASIPYRAPFTAYINNLPFDVEEEEIRKFFHECKVRYS